MNQVLLDTSAYLACMKGHEKIQDILRSAEAIYFNPIVLGEIYRGFRLGGHREKNESELNEFIAGPRVKFIDVDEDTSERYALIANDLQAKGTPISTNDIWISASAMQYGLAVLTLDRDFLRVQQIITLCPEPPAS